MLVNPQHFDYLNHLSEQLESGDHFELNLKNFLEMTERIRDHLYRHTSDLDVIDALDALPVIETQAYRRSFLEQMLPKPGREMVGNYKNREIIRSQVRETARILNKVRRWLEEDDELV